MRAELTSRERGVWIGTVAVLSTSLAWMAMLQMVWLAHAAVQARALVVVARVLARVVWSVPGAGPLALLAVYGLATVVILVMALASVLRQPGALHV